MSDRTLVKIGSNDCGFTFRTISRKRKSPQCFYITLSSYTETGVVPYNGFVSFVNGSFM